MIENQSVSKKQRSDYQPSGDLLSDLPLSIIHIILALVPIRDAVRTSVLSRQWRYTWSSLPHLVFDDECPSYLQEDGCKSYDIKVRHEKRVKNFVTHALFHHKGPIHKFKISTSFIRRTRILNIDEWMLCLSRNDIKELTLNMGEPDYHTSVQVHSSIYSCEKLTHLELSNCKLDPPPSTFKGFLFLRCLILQDVCTSSNEIESLVANSPFLERFDLMKPEMSKLRISSPSLKYLDIWGSYVELCVCAPLLAEMSVELLSDNFTAKQSVCNYANFMGGFTNLEKLSGYMFFSMFLSIGIESCHRTLVFLHLKDIELNMVNFADINEISVVARLINGAPNLHKLNISTTYVMNEDDDASDSEAPDVSFRDFGCAPNFAFEKLKVVIMNCVNWIPPEVELIKFLLESSPVLETMSVSIFLLLTEEKKQNVTAELLGFGRASPNAKLSVT